MLAIFVGRMDPRIGPQFLRAGPAQHQPRAAAVQVQPERGNPRQIGHQHSQEFAPVQPFFALGHGEGKDHQPIDGSGRGQGLFFPAALPQFDDIDALLALPLAERSAAILGRIIGDELPAEQLAAMVGRAFNFPAPVVKVSDRIHALELFHGPTLAFKDFGGRFMAQCLGAFADGEKITILTATSGDTGAAVAHAFYGLEGIEVVILYPKGKISPLQEALFCTLGGNIRTLAIDGAADLQIRSLLDNDQFADPAGAAEAPRTHPIY